MIESRTAAAQAVLQNMAEPAEPEVFWEAIAVADDAEQMPPEVEEWLYAILNGTRFYPRGILAQYALGRTIRSVSMEKEDVRPVEAANRRLHWRHAS